MSRRRKADTTTSSTIVETTPAQVLSELARAIAPVEALFVQRALSGERMLEAIDALVPDRTTAQVDLTLRARGGLKRGGPSTRRATSRALRKATIALLVRRLGLAHAEALAVLTELLQEAQNLSEADETALLTEVPSVGEAFATLDAALDALPRLETRGPVSLADVIIERTR